MIDIKIDPQSAVPPFEQLREAVIARIASGELAPGSKLPGALACGRARPCRKHCGAKL